MPASSSKITFFFDDAVVTLKNKKALKTLVQEVFRKEKKMLSSLNYIFCSDKRLLEINKQYLGHDYYTDIITFDLSNSKAVEGEIYISVDRVKENAKTLSISLQDELNRVMVHGVLHLCGHKDGTRSEKSHMRKLEDRYLRAFD